MEKHTSPCNILIISCLVVSAYRAGKMAAHCEDVLGERRRSKHSYPGDSSRQLFPNFELTLSRPVEVPHPSTRRLFDEPGPLFLGQPGLFAGRVEGLDSDLEPPGSLPRCPPAP